MYTHDSTHEGWPVLKNAKGRYCYRYTPGDKWYLRDAFNPDEDLCNAHIVAKEGPLPVGAHTWRIAPSAVGRPKGSGFVDITFTVGLLVRPPLPAPRCPPTFGDAPQTTDEDVAAAEEAAAAAAAEKAKAEAAKAAKALAEVQTARSPSAASHQCRAVCVRGRC